jgi:hypothetical protein
MNHLDSPQWCCLCPRRAGFHTDMGYLCSGCFYQTQKLMVWLLEHLGWRPMDKDERRAHAHKTA